MLTSPQHLLYSDALPLATSHEGDSGTIIPTSKAPKGYTQDTYMIVRQCKIAPNIYVTIVPIIIHMLRPEFNVVLHFISEISVTYV